MGAFQLVFKLVALKTKFGRALTSSAMKFLNTFMLAIGWFFVVFAVLCALGLGSIHMHLGPLDFKLPFHWR
jgi:hypothetical protein